MPKSTTPTHTETEVKPDPALEKRGRRSFTREYKLKIIALADSCKHGELGELLRKEKLYANQIIQWRKEVAEHGQDSLSKTTPGPSASPGSEQRRIRQLEAEVSRLRQQLLIKDSCLELQKKALSMLEHLSNESIA